MPSISDILKKKGKILEGAEDAFHKAIKRTERRIWSGIKKVFDRFNISDGKFKNNVKNRNLLVELENNITKAFDPLSEPIGNYVKNFDRIKELNADYFENILTKEEFKTIESKFRQTNQIKASLIDDLTEGLTNKKLIKQNLVKPIRDTLFRSVIFESSFKDAERALRKEIISTDTNSKVLRYTIQLSRDALNGYDGMLQDKIADEYGLDGFRYLGSLATNSRQNCIDWVEGIGLFKSFYIKEERAYRVEDIPQMIEFARGRGGWNEATTPETFAQYRGGYNCRHRVVYIRLLNE